MNAQANDKVSNLSTKNLNFEKQESIFISAKNKIQIEKKAVTLDKNIKLEIPQKKNDKILNSPRSIASSDEYQGLSYKSCKKTATVDVNSSDKHETLEKGDAANNSTWIGSKKSFEDYKIKYKTEKCKYFDVNKACKFGESCAFAHGLQDIREKSFICTNYKTKKCKQFFEQGYCPYGLRCQFLHKKSSTNSASSDATKNSTIVNYSYKKLINELINSSDNISYGSEENSKRPRLKTFEQIITVDTCFNRFELYNDILLIKQEDRNNGSTNKQNNNILDVSKDENDNRSRFMSA